MLLACWSAKGGSGTTVVATGVATLLARHAPTLLADLQGDAVAALGVPEPSGPGLGQWLAAAPGHGPSLDALLVDLGDGLALAPTGRGRPLPLPGAGERLALALAARPMVVADCGLLGDGAGPDGGGPGLAVAAAATTSLMVLRPCYLALRRALRAPVRASGVVLVEEERRALDRRDVEDALGVPVVATVPWAAAVARSVDAGLLRRKPPRGLAPLVARAVAGRVVAA